MKANCFEELNIWKLSRALVKEIYTVTQKTKFLKDYNLATQFQRAGISVNANIAEGFERNTRKEFIHFLFISKGSCGEIRSLLYLSLDLDYISDTEFSELKESAVTLSKSIASFIRYLKNNPILK
jgi:four helix bundle protein